MNEEKQPVPNPDAPQVQMFDENLQQSQDAGVRPDTANLVRDVSYHFYNVRGWMTFLGILQIVIGAFYAVMALFTLLLGAIPGLMSFTKGATPGDITISSTMGIGIVGLIYLVTAAVIITLGILYTKSARCLGAAGIMGNPVELKFSLKHLSTAILIQAISILAGVLIFVLVFLLAILMGASAG